MSKERLANVCPECGHINYTLKEAGEHIFDCPSSNKRKKK